MDKYEEALQRARELYETGNFLTRQQVGIIFPELRESEDERIRKELIHAIDEGRVFDIDKEVADRWIAWLEKQKDSVSNAKYIKDIANAFEDGRKKEDRLAPIYEDIDSFESALEKAWKSYNDSGSRTVDGCEDDYVECAHAKGFREGYLFGLEKQKKQKPAEKSEIPTNLDLDKEIADYFKDPKTGRPYFEWTEGVYMPQNTILEFASHFYELGRNSKPAEWSEEDELTIADLINYFEGDSLECSTEEMVQRIKSLRPSWKPSEKQMMKEAVKGEIVDSGFDDGTAILKAIVPDKRYNSGDKVKVIVIKED